MPALEPQCLDHKCLEAATVNPTTAIAVGLAVDENGAAVTTPGAYVYGFAFFNGEANCPLTVETRGECIAVAGGAFAKGDPLAVNANSKLVVAVAGNHVVAKALETVANPDLYTIVHKENYIAP